MTATPVTLERAMDYIQQMFPLAKITLLVRDPDENIKPLLMTNEIDKETALKHLISNMDGGYE